MESLLTEAREQFMKDCPVSRVKYISVGVDFVRGNSHSEDELEWNVYGHSLNTEKMELGTGKTLEEAIDDWNNQK